MASKFGGVPVDELLEQNNDLSPSKFGGVPVDQITPIVDQEDKAGFGTNLFRTIGGAARDVAQATLDVGSDLEKAIPLGGFSTQDNPETEEVEGFRYVGPKELKLLNEYYGGRLPEVAEPTYPGGSFVRDVTGFLAPVSAVNKVATPIKAVTTGQKIAKGAGVGAVAEQFAFSPYEQRISNLVQSVPSLQNPVTEFLQADPNDSAATARFKMALEGGAVGIPVDAALRAFGKLRTNNNVQKVADPQEPTIKKEEPEIQPEIKPEEPTIKPEENFAGNINLNKINSTDDVKNIIDDVAKNNNDFLKARRGVVPFGSQGEELQALAKETGLDEKQLLKRKVGEAFNAETAYAARVLNVQSAENLVNLSKKAKNINATADDLIKFEEALTRHVAIQEQVAGITAEAGRALRSFKEMASSTGAIQERLIKDFIKQKGGRESIEDVADFISKLDTPEQIADFSKNTFKANNLDKIQEAWINALLSSPSTHAVNILSNSIVALSRIPEYGLASIGGLVRKGPDKVTFTELGARILGNIYGTLDGFRVGAKALVDPESITDPLTKVELQRQNAISGPVGSIIRTPGRFLVAEDAFFKSIGYRQELWGQAIRQAKKEGKGVDRALEILKDPAKNFPDIELKSQDTARYQTFTNPLGETGQAIQKIIQKNPSFRFIVPFLRTPFNIVKYAAQRTPLGLFSRTYKEAVKKGGAEADIARSRVALGSSTMALVSYLASQGLVTGRGPSDSKQRNTLRETGWQPYSLKIGDSYYGYNRFEPVGILFGLAADGSDIGKYVDEGFMKSNDGEISELVSMIMASATQNLTNKTFLSGVTEAINAISDPDRYGERWINRFSSSFIPTGIYYQRKSDDPLVRDAQNMMDSFYNRIPGLSDKLPAKRNVFGETIQYTPTYSPDFLGQFGKTFSPISKSPITNDLVFNELVKLEISPSMPRRSIDDVKLEPAQYEDMLLEMQNLGTKQYLENIIKSSAYQKLPKSQKIDLIKNVIKKNQSAARDITKIKNPEIIEQSITNLIEQLNE